MSFRAKGWSLALFLAVALSAPNVFAGEGSGSANKEADARFEEGVKLLKKGKFEEARVKLTQSFALDPLPNVALSLAIAEDALGRHVEALRHAKVFLEHPKSDPKRVAEVRDTLYQDLWKKTAHVHVVAEPGADVMVDTESVGRAPIAGTVDMLPGEHTLRSGAHAENVRIAAGETKNVDLAPKSAAGALAAQTPGGGPAPAPSAPPPGVQQPAREPSSATAKYVVGGSLLALGVGAFVTGVVFSVQGQSARADADALFAKPATCDLTPTDPLCIKAADLTSRVNDKATLATVFYVSGALLGLGGVATLALWPDPKPDAKKNAASVRVAPGFGSLHLTGTFR
ncbi:MAG: hypothetical protein U0174_19820 [Polyangiaceae bacterium]